MLEPIFHRDGGRFVASGLARGPWDPDACHGGAPAALLASLIDATPGHVPMQVARLTFEIERSVPIGAALHSHLEVTREGKRVQVIDASLRTHDDVTLVRCRAVRIRVGEVAVPPQAGQDLPAPVPAPKQLARFTPLEGWRSEGFWSAVDLRFVDGALGEVGPGVVWANLRHPIAEGLDTTPLARAAAVGDFGNGVGSPLPMDRFLYINPDLTIHLHRQPLGPWIALATSSIAHDTGIGLATSTLFDAQGRIGSASQTLFIDPL